MVSSCSSMSSSVTGTEIVVSVSPSPKVIVPLVSV